MDCSEAEKKKKVPQGQIHLEHRDHRDRPVTRLDSDAGELELNGHDDRDACRIGWVTCIDRQQLRCQSEPEVGRPSQLVKKLSIQSALTLYCQCPRFQVRLTIGLEPNTVHLMLSDRRVGRALRLNRDGRVANWHHAPL